jgi:crossover junction endodeoxyribonuclease RuvC
MGIDPSLTGFAVCIENEGKWYEAEWGSTPVVGLKGRFGRYCDLVYKTVRLVNKYDPQLILLEGYSYASKGRSIVTLAEFGGVLRHELLGTFRRIIEIPPTLLKKFTTGKGNASKSLMVSCLSSRYSREFDTDNKADAFALAKLGLVVLGYESASTAYQKAVDLKVRALMEQEI